MSQNIYPIQLLNDLHNHFPEILYNPNRFQNVSDLLLYIRSIANINPYERGMQQYNTQQNRSLPNHIPPINPITHINTQFPQTFITMFEEITPSTTQIQMPLNNNTLMTTLISGLFGDVLNTNTTNGLQSFLDQRVPIYPTVQEISNATTEYTADRNLEDICAICQDEIELNQNVRKILHCNHYFHKDCIDTWFRGNVHCPTCRHDIRVTDTAINNPPPVPENYRRMNIRRSDNP